jgi:ATP-dependent DNA helicase DinG
MEDYFGPGGVIASSLGGFESRAEQLSMAVEVEKALSGGKILVVEAGTGVGKSFAYLVPAIELISRGVGKILVSTYTITLQEQLINKDIPFLGEHLGRGFSAVLAKGRGNYLCRRRLEYAQRRQRGLFDKFGEQLAAILQWAGRSSDGSLSDIDFVPAAAVWDAVNSEHGNCRGRKCAHFRDCFYQRARRRLDSADIIVANHALMFSDLVLKEEGASILPEYRYVIVDEAHNIEHVAEEHFGIDISNGRIRFLLGGIYNPRSRKGLLAYRKADKAIKLVGAAEKAGRAFFKDVSKWYELNKGQNGGRCYQNFVEDSLSGALRNLRLELGRMAKAAEDSDDKFEFFRFADRLLAAEQDLNCFLMQGKEGYVYWVEASAERKANVRLKSASLNVGPDIKRTLLDNYKSVVMTSATLSTDSAEGGFVFFAGRIGLKDFHGVKLGSPFDYAKQVTIYIEKDLPNPNEPGFIKRAAEAIKKYVTQTAGRAFVLFTSYDMLEKMADILGEWFVENQIGLLQQGAGIDRSKLLNEFRRNKAAVLFGTESFWQGVDVPGEALSNVIIVRLPFAVPDKPLIAGRLEQIKEQGGNAFLDYQLPSAILKFKQGFGRLIRSKTDTGIVVILDSRIVQKRYGGRFLAAVPKCKVEVVKSRVRG